MSAEFRAAAHVTHEILNMPEQHLPPIGSKQSIAIKLGDVSIFGARNDDYGWGWERQP